MFCRLSVAALCWAAISCSSEKAGSPQDEEEAVHDHAALGNQVRLTTSLGEIVVEVFPDKSPKSATNFLRYVDQGHYDGTLFHRIIDGYLIEAGKVTVDQGTLVEKAAGDPIINEARNGLRNERGTLAMARTARPDSATAAFFINLGDNIALNYPQPDGHGYAVFGRVVSGMDVADQIGKLKTGVLPITLLHPLTGLAESQKVADVPDAPVTIISAARLPK